MDINQSSFDGGMDLLSDDTKPKLLGYGSSQYFNTYRTGFNMRCRYNALDSILSSRIDPAAPVGLKQAILTFGDYIVLFVAGFAYYRLNTATGWAQIQNFKMSSTAPRFWTVAVPVATTNYGRLAAPTINPVTGVTTTAANSRGTISAVSIGASFGGNQPGLLVQDGISQPQFIFLDINNNNQITSRVTKTFDEWTFTISGPTAMPPYEVTVDQREYVPIGTFMEWYNGVLMIVSNDYETIYRSVSGRPLDFVVNVDINGGKGGDASTTAYSVGIGGITCMKQVSGAIFISAGTTACFAVTFDLSNNAPQEFGEYKFIRTFLFTAGCLSDRGLIDTNGDTTFIDVYGLRSFNAIQQQDNEGRNSVFSKQVSSLFTNLVQDGLLSAAVTFDNYSLYAVNTIYGYAIIVYDNLSGVYVSVDRQQVDSTVAIVQFAVINTTVTELYAITSDNKLIQLYAGPEFDEGICRFMSGCSLDPKMELRENNFRCVLSNFIQDSTVTLTTFTNNRLSFGPETKNITYETSTTPYTGPLSFPDIDTQVNNLLFSMPNNGQGWKVFNVLQWTGGGRITNVDSIGTSDLTPMNPLLSQGITR